MIFDNAASSFYRLDSTSAKTLARFLSALSDALHSLAESDYAERNQLFKVRRHIRLAVKEMSRCIDEGLDVQGALEITSYKYDIDRQKLLDTWRVLNREKTARERQDRDERICAAYRDGRPVTQIAAEFGLSRTTIYKITAGVRSRSPNKDHQISENVA